MRQHSLNTLDFQPDTSSVDGQTSAWGASPRTWKTPGGIPVVFRPSPTLAGDSTTDPAALRLHLDHARLIKKHECPKHAKGVQKYFKQTVRSYGIRTPLLRQIEKDLFLRVRGQWTEAEALALSEMMLPKKHLEPKVLCLLLLSRFGRKAHTIGANRRWAIS